MWLLFFLLQLMLIIMGIGVCIGGTIDVFSVDDSSPKFTKENLEKSKEVYFKKLSEWSDAHPFDHLKD